MSRLRVLYTDNDNIEVKVVMDSQRWTGSFQRTG